MEGGGIFFCMERGIGQSGVYATQIYFSTCLTTVHLFIINSRIYLSRIPIIYSLGITYLPICVSISTLLYYLLIYLSCIYPFTCAIPVPLFLCIYYLNHLSIIYSLIIHVYIYLPAYRPIYPSIRLSTCLHLSPYLSTSHLLASTSLST